jgi:hypothetical protein
MSLIAAVTAVCLVGAGSLVFIGGLLLRADAKADAQRRRAAADVAAAMAEFAKRAAAPPSRAQGAPLDEPALAYGGVDLAQPIKALAELAKALTGLSKGLQVLFVACVLFSFAVALAIVDHSVR